jgi:heme/copper-type cytochrome/quinol oxidase subunit 2
MVMMPVQDAVATVERQLRRQRHFTLPEAAALTGLSIDNAREALEALLTKYVCRLQVSENGDLIYNFGTALRRRNHKTLSERAQEMGAWLWKGFTVFYKAWITVTLVVYFVVFLVLLIVFLIASSSRQSSDDRRQSSTLDLGPILYMFLSIFQWRTVTDTIAYDHDRYGYRYRRYATTPGILDRQKKNFIAAVYDFVFGPPRATCDPLQNEKEVAAYLRQQKGIIVTSELSALAGWTFPQAETFLTDCVIRYQGDTQVSDNAVLYGTFDTIVRSVGEADEGKIVYYWDEYEPDYELTGNSSTYNLIIGAMNGFNLVLATLVLSGGFAQLLQPRGNMALNTIVAGLLNGPFANLMFGWLPLIFSALFFAIPLARLLRLGVLRQHQHVQNIRKRLFKAIFARRGQPQVLTAIQSAVNANPREEALSRQGVEDMLQTLSLDLQGDMTVNEAAELQFAFPRISRELQEVERLRRQRHVDQALGKIIVESDNVVEPDQEG